MYTYTLFLATIKSNGLPYAMGPLSFPVCPICL